MENHSENLNQQELETEIFLNGIEYGLNVAFALANDDRTAEEPVHFGALLHVYHENGEINFFAEEEPSEEDEAEFVELYLKAAQALGAEEEDEAEEA